MNKNIKVAKELVKLAKSLMAEGKNKIAAQFDNQVIYAITP